MQGLTVARKILLAFTVLLVVFIAFGVFASFTGRRLNLAAVRLQEANEGVMMAFDSYFMPILTLFLDRLWSDPCAELRGSRFLRKQQQ